MMNNNSQNFNEELSWLHLADLQFGSFSSNNYTKKLLDDIIKQIERNRLGLDFIFVTGDVAAAGQSEEYREAASFFQDLLAQTNLERKRLFLVPGNHDSDWNSQYLSRQNNSESKKKPFDVAQFALDNYNSFLNLFLGDSASFPILHNGKYVFTSRLKLSGREIAILGLDTSWLNHTQISNESRERVHELFSSQIQIALKGINIGAIVIALMHHSPDDLSIINNGAVTNILLDRCHLILHSHAHKQDLQERTETNKQDTAIIINSGSNYTFEIHPNVYSLVQMDLSKCNGKIFRRILDLKQGGWQQSSRTIEFNIPALSRLKFRSEDNQTINFPKKINTRIPGTILPGYANDTNNVSDQLGINRDVNAFAAVLAARQVEPPLCLGLFGDWGSGKSFFMGKLKDRINLLADKSREAETRNEKTEFYSYIAQIEFNAWHYADSNLWASLACSIFEELDNYTDKHWPKEKVNLFTELEAARQMRLEAEKRINNVIEEKEQIENQIKAIYETSSTTIKQRDAINLLLHAAKNLGVNITDKNFKQVKDTFEQFGSLKSRIKLAFISLWHAPDRWRRIALLAIFLIAIPLVPVFVNWLLSELIHKSIFINVSLTRFLTFITGMSIWLGSLFRKISQGMDKFENAKKEVDKYIEHEDQPLRAKEQQLAKELKELETKENLAKQGLLDAEIRFAQASAALDRAGKIDNGQSLIEFIRRQTTNEAMINQLGIVSSLRKNLETLSCKLVQKENDNQSDVDLKLPRIDRIILYIDDLDRCSEKAVVDVLQAVHLLLAFKLFIVVVGVDSRWLLHSLEKEYPTLLDDPQKREGWSIEELQAWEATPQNYLEKIFQIPYNLRPMNVSGYINLINSILPVASNEGNLENEKWSATISTLPNKTPTVKDSDLDTSSNSDKSIKNKNLSRIEFDESSSIATDSIVSLIPEFLKIEPHEKEFSFLLSDFLSTPRSTKRFVNIYRLIRATIGMEDLEFFVGSPNNSNAGEFRAVMLLLAILIGFPQQSPHFFQKLLSLNKEYAWKDALALIYPRPSNTEGIFMNDILQHLTIAEANEWIRLHRSLVELEKKSLLPSTLQTYAKWIADVSRFSFRAGKLIAKHNTSSNL